MPPSNYRMLLNEYMDSIRQIQSFRLFALRQSIARNSWMEASPFTKHLQQILCARFFNILGRGKENQLHHRCKDVPDNKARINWQISMGNIERRHGNIAKFEYRAADWKKRRRMVAVRKNIELLPKATGKLLLFDEPVGKYRYSLYVTNLDLPAEQIWLSYKDSADAQNRIKELKYDFGLDSFCMEKFWATEAAFRTIMIAYNLMSLFGQIVVKSNTKLLWAH